MPHVGHVRGRVHKDLWYRFTTLRGAYVIFVGGWDTHGLPLEIEAERELGLFGKKHELIKRVGMKRLVEKAKEIINRYHKFWVLADELMGLMMDHGGDYWTCTDEYIEREWQYLRRAWDRGILGESYQVVGYCPGCQTALSHTEVSSEYELLEDPSLYFKVRVEGRENTYLLLWTTMPFTIITDIMIGVNPNVMYSLIRVGDERWIVASERANALFDELGLKDVTEEERFVGESLEGLRYHYPLAEEVQASAKLYREGAYVVVCDGRVDTKVGSGLVHMAPANGDIDFDVAKRAGLPIFNPFDDRVYFTEEAGKYAGIFARDADQLVIEDLKRKGLVVKVGRIVHEYPTCWRSHHRLVWLARREYFYWIDQLADKLVEAAERVQYYNDAAKHRFLNIIKEKRPWCISRERIWGTPLPIWVCSSCGEKMLLASREEIVKSAVEIFDDPNFELHRPWIDRIKVRCRKCGGIAYREPYVLDTWHNSGAAPYASLSDEEYEKYIPVEFLTEGIDQTRGWAYTLLALNVVFKDEPEAPYKSFIFQGIVLGPDGMKMSKSLGNVIDGIETLQRYPVDALRLYVVWKSPLSDAFIFKPDEITARPFQVLNTLYHLHVYHQQNSRVDGFDDSVHTLEWAIRNGKMKLPDAWILSKLQDLIQKVTKAYDSTAYNEAARELERFIIEHLSQKYVPSIRKEIWDDSPETLARRLTIYSVMAYVLKTVDILLHPISPFLTEKLYRECFFAREESILLEDWPRSDSRLIRRALEEKFELVESLVSLSNSVRMKARLKRRWPVRKVYLVLDRDVEFSDEEMELLRELLNSKEVLVTRDFLSTPVELRLRPKLEILGKKLRERLQAFLRFLELEDHAKLYHELREKGQLVLTIEGHELTVQLSDFETSIVARHGFEMGEERGLGVVMMSERDAELIAEGIMRDVVRRVQSYRKELGLNPVEIVKEVVVASEDAEIVDSLKGREDVVRFLVRASAVRISGRPEYEEVWKVEEVEGKKLWIKIIRS